MEQQKLPNAQTVLILGIVSIVGTCCCTGVVGIICGLIALNLYKKDKVLYDANPSLYTDFNNLNTGRILAIIGVSLAALHIIYLIVMFSTVGIDGYMDMMRELSQMKR